jgi:hypothetical protein
MNRDYEIIKEDWDANLVVDDFINNIRLTMDIIVSNVLEDAQIDGKVAGFDVGRFEKLISGVMIQESNDFKTQYEEEE